MNGTHLKLAIRNLTKAKVYVLINTLGIGTAIACCIMAFVNYENYVDFDAVHDEAKMVYRVNSTRVAEGEVQRWGVTPLALGPAITADIPGIERYARLSRGFVSVKSGNELLPLDVIYVDTAFFEMFDFPVKHGSVGTISDPNSITLTHRDAIRFFGDEYAVGKALTLVFLNQGLEREVTVGAVLQDMPLNSSLVFGGAMPISELMKLEGWVDENWTYWQQPINFVELAPGTSADRVEDQLERYVPVQNAARPNWMVASFDIQPFGEVASTAEEFEETALNTPPPFELILILSGLAGLILLIACFNFTNTTIALSGNRVREIGLRKAVGAQRTELISQFMTETVILIIPGLVTGLGLAHLLTTGLSELGVSIPPETSQLLDMRLWAFLIGLLALTGILAGSYPALYMTRFKPVEIFAGRSKFRGSSFLTRTLLGAQMSASILAIVGGIVFTQNAAYQRDLPLGFNTTEIIAMPIFNASVVETYGETIKAHPRIKAVAASGSQVGSFSYQAIFSEDTEGAQEHNVHIVDVGPGYMEIMDLEMVSGRMFDETRATDYEAAIVNEELALEMGWDTESAIGKPVVSDGRPYTVIGVVKDFKQFGMREAIPPVSMHMVGTDRFYTMAIRANTEDHEQVRDYLEKEWYETFPNMPFYSIHMDDLVRGEDVRNNERMATLFLLLALVATILSAVGLFALVSLRIVARTKEIGIRKVFGAPFGNLVFLINREFLTILVLALGAGSALGYFLSNQILDEMYAFRVGLDATAGLIALLAIVVTAVITIGSRVYGAANANPVESLRAE